MKKFLLRICFFTIVLLFGILFGITHSQQSSLSQTEGIQEPPMINETSQTVQEEEGTERELVEKQRIADEANVANFYSELGTKLGDLFHHLFSSFITTIIGTIHSFLHSK